MEAYQGRSLIKISAASAPKNVSGKAPSRKRPLPASEVEAPHSSDRDAQNTGANFQAEVVNPKTLVMFTRTAERPVDLPPSGPCS